MKHPVFYGNLLRLLPQVALRRITHKRCKGFATIEHFVSDKEGLEIGGPSSIFLKKGMIPIYDCCGRIDLCDFSERTLWSDQAQENVLGRKLGERYFAEASDLSGIPDATYDFVLASHVLEHIANPFRAVLEWKRLLRPGGALLVVVPDKRRTFDRMRTFTTFDHLEADYQANIGEDDLAHLDEILRLHDLRLDPAAGSAEQFRARCLQNAAVRGMHHHVFSPEVLGLTLSRSGYRVLNIASEPPWHIVAFAQKPESKM